MGLFCVDFHSPGCIFEWVCIRTVPHIYRGGIPYNGLKLFVDRLTFVCARRGFVWWILCVRSGCINPRCGSVSYFIYRKSRTKFLKLPEMLLLPMILPPPGPSPNKSLIFQNCFYFQWICLHFPSQNKSSNFHQCIYFQWFRPRVPPRQTNPQISTNASTSNDVVPACPLAKQVLIFPKMLLLPMISSPAAPTSPHPSTNKISNFQKCFYFQWFRPRHPSPHHRCTQNPQDVPRLMFWSLPVTTSNYQKYFYFHGFLLLQCPPPTHRF